MKYIKKIANYINDKEYKIILKNNELNIINYDSIIDFSTRIISVSKNNIIFFIEGNNLKIVKMYENELLIKGNIFNVSIKNKNNS